MNRAKVAGGLKIKTVCYIQGYSWLLWMVYVASPALMSWSVGAVAMSCGCPFHIGTVFGWNE